MCTFEQTDALSYFIDCGDGIGVVLVISSIARCFGDMSLMSISRTTRVDSRDAHPFPRAQECGQTGCLVIPQATGLPELRFLTVYCSGDRIGVDCEKRSGKEC